MTTLGIISVKVLFTLIIAHYLIIIYLLYLVLKKEKGQSLLVWVLLILFVPIIGICLYIFKNKAERKKDR